MILRRAPARWCWIAILTALVCFAPFCLAKKKPPPHPINLNSASALELQQVPGIGPSTADKILQMRKSYGAFKSVDDLLAIKRLGPKKLQKMRKYLTVRRPVKGNKSATAAQAASVQEKSPPPLKSPATKSVPKQTTAPPTEAESEEP